MALEIRIPQLGESVTEGVSVQWLTEDGALVQADEPVLEIETEKAAMEIAAPAAGRVRILQPVGARVAVGAVVGRIEEAPVGAAAPAATSAPPAASVEAPGPAPAAERPAASAPPRPATAAPTPTPALAPA